MHPGPDEEGKQCVHHCRSSGGWECSPSVHSGHCCTWLGQPWDTGLVGSYIIFGCRMSISYSMYHQHGEFSHPLTNPIPRTRLGMSPSTSRQHGLSQGGLLLALSLTGKRLDQSKGSPTLCRNHAVKPRNPKYIEKLLTLKKSKSFSARWIWFLS